MKSMRKRNMFFMLILALMFISIGYAFVYSDLKLEGLTTVTKQTWNVYFDNLVVTEGSVTPITAASLSGEYPTTIAYSVKLENPGDFYEFTVDAVNDGSIDAMINTISSTNNGNEISLPSYIEYKVSYFTGQKIKEKHLLKSNDSIKYKIGIYFKKDITKEQLENSQPLDLRLKFEVIYIQADETGIIPPIPVSFKDDDWNTIAIEGAKAATQKEIENSKCGPYNIGDTKQIDLGSLGKHTVRIANCTTPDICQTEGFSQTACGFVIEFEDIITTRRMNPVTQEGAVNGDGNKGGWEYSDMRAYLNSGVFALENIDYSTTGFYDKLPQSLKNTIINTTVVSGYGSNDRSHGNFITTDNIYLLNPTEIWGRTIEGDPAGGKSRQLDYYKIKGVTTSGGYTPTLQAVKKLNGTATQWWLRTPRPNNSTQFFFTHVNGSWYYHYYNQGVSPAFRISVSE